MEPSKVILTEKNRIRFSACSVLDVVQHDLHRPLEELQQEDFIHFGKLIVAIATNIPTAQLVGPSIQAAVDQVGRIYTQELRHTLTWLLTPAQAPAINSIDQFLSGISGYIAASFDASLHQSDSLNSELYRELENGRIVRLLMKLNAINERPEHDGDKNWSETGGNYMLMLFRDYVFHQVDAQGRSVVDLAHMLRCLNKLDAGAEEKIMLSSRDEQNVFVVTYKELKKLVASAFGDLLKSTGPKRY